MARMMDEEIRNNVVQQIASYYQLAQGEGASDETFVKQMQSQGVTNAEIVVGIGIVVGIEVKRAQQDQRLRAVLADRGRWS